VHYTFRGFDNPILPASETPPVSPLTVGSTYAEIEDGQPRRIGFLKHHDDAGNVTSTSLRYFEHESGVWLATRWDCTDQSVKAWRKDYPKRYEALLRGSKLPYCNTPIDDLEAECNKRGFYIESLVEVSEWSRNTIKSFRSGPRVARLWDLIRGI